MTTTIFDSSFFIHCVAVDSPDTKALIEFMQNTQGLTL